MTNLPTIQVQQADPGPYQRRVPADANRRSGDDPQKLREAAQEFESLFLSYILKVMRESIHESEGAENSFGRGMYTELFDQEVARTLAGRNALGIGELIMKSIAGSGEASGDSPDFLSPLRLPESKGPDFRMPVEAPVSSPFGLRNDPITRQIMFHQGVDLAASEGSEIRAASDGRVVYSGYRRGYGNTVVLAHPRGYVTRYAHLGSLEVEKGDSIEAGSVLGKVGDTGRSTGPHLHFEVSRGGENVDPLAVLDK